MTIFFECTEKNIDTKMLAVIILGDGIWGDYNIFLCVYIFDNNHRLP